VDFVNHSWSWVLLETPQLCSYLRTYQHFMEPEGTLPLLKEPSTFPNPEPDKSNPYHTIPSYLSKIYFNIVYAPTSWSSQCLFPTGFPTNIHHSCYMPCQSHPPWLDRSKGYKLWTSSIRSFLQPPVTSSLFGPSILNTLFSNTLSLWSSFNVRDQVSHSYSTTGKNIVFYSLIFMFLDSRREDKWFWTEW
jgi:hypothetical protein